MRVLSALFMLWPILMLAQANPASNPSGAPAKGLAEAAKQGAALGVLNVSEQISLKAVLLTPTIVNRVFGKDVRNNYAVVHLTVSNKSRDAAFILHHVFLDYSDWLAAPGSPNTISANPSNSQNSAFNLPRQLGSVEARIVRGELQDAQNWTWRNVLIRSLKTAGAISSAYAFTAGEGFARGIASYNGNVVPALEVLLPDPMIAQMNRISDYGFRTPTVIPREDGNVIVAFFPLDRLLTPSLKDIYLKNPAVFFTPELIAVDRKAQQLLAPTIESLFDGGMTGFRDAAKTVVTLSQAELTGTGQPSNRPMPDYDNFIQFVRKLSLENVRLGVEGVMVIDARTVPGTTTDIEWQSTADIFWQTPGKKKAKLIGRSLDGAEVQIVSMETLGIKDLKTGKVGPDGRSLEFECEFTAPIASGTEIVLRVVKRPDGGAEIVGNDFVYKVAYQQSAPELKSLKWESPLLTIDGDRFFESTLAERLVELRSGETLVFRDFKSESTSKIELELKELSVGCYGVTVRSGNLLSTPLRYFAKLPEAKLRSAKIVDGKLEVEWEPYPDLSPCGVKRKFVVSKQGQVDSILKGEAVVEGVDNRLRFLKPEPLDETWQVRMELGQSKGPSIPIAKE